MKLSRLPIYILAIVITFASCQKDEIRPELTVSLEDTNGQYFLNEEILVAVEASDNKQLQEIRYLLTSDGAPDEQGSVPVSGEVFTGQISIAHNMTISQDFRIFLEAEDEAGNAVSQELDLHYTHADPGSVQLAFKLQYDGAPLVMFEDYAYPDGRAIEFTRFSMYVSDLSIGGSYAEDIAFLNLTNAHADLESAEKGLVVPFARVAPNSYDRIRFGVGVNETKNQTGPSDYPSSHPLARSGEHWFSWNSYIFLKVEANMDSNGDGQKDLPIALHIGADDAYRFTEIQRTGEVVSNQDTNEDIIIDLYEFFGGQNVVYNIDETSSIHALSQSEAMLELVSNYSQCFK